MGEIATQAGRKVVAGTVLAIVAYVLFKIVVGLVTGLAFVAAAIVALVVVVWALRAI